MPRYLTRFKLRQKKSPLMKLAKAAVSAIDELFEGYEAESDENHLEMVNAYLEGEMEKETGKRTRIMKELKRYLSKEEPGETDDEEEIEDEETEEEEEEGVDEEEIREDEVHEDEDENQEEEENVVDGDGMDHPEEEELVVNEEAGEDEEDQSLVEREYDSIENVIGNASPQQKTAKKSDPVTEVSLIDLLADQSVTARDGTFNDLLKERCSSRAVRSTSLFDLGSKKSHSLASLLTAAPPTPLRSVGSVSEQSLFVEETLSRRARRSSQDLAHHLLYNDRTASPLGHVGNPNSNFVTPTMSDQSVICLGTVKKPTPPLIILDDTPKRRTMFPREQQTTPELPMDFVGVRARLRRVPGSPMEQEMRRMTMEGHEANKDTPILGGTTDRHVTDMEISPVQNTDRNSTEPETSPSGKSSSSEVEELPAIPPKPRPRKGRLTPFPDELRKKN